ncbi:MAG: hypothetical protein P8Q97_00775 [Myxococcota bacterium]|jgi:hypothetical protein|nr:hypothetical protein [Myxococcota bacterium]
MKRLQISLMAIGLFFLLGPGSPVRAENPESDASAMRVLDAFMTAFNARQVDAFEATLNFPHYRIAGGQVSVLEEAGTRPDMFARFTSATPGWDHSAWARRNVVHSGPSKVHIDTRFIRYRADGAILSEFDSLYIVTLQDGEWGIKARSSFAP